MGLKLFVNKRDYVDLPMYFHQMKEKRHKLINAQVR